MHVKIVLVHMRISVSNVHFENEVKRYKTPEVFVYISIKTTKLSKNNSFME